MTEQDFTQAVNSGKVTAEEPASSDASPSHTASAPAPAAQASEDIALQQFIPILVGLQSTQRYLSAAPTFVPQTFQDQLQFVFDGTKYSVYVYFNNQWNQVKIPGGLSTVKGTDTATLTSHSASTTHTITHGLDGPVKMIMCTTQLTPAGVPGANRNDGQGVGDVILDGSGNIIGGFCASVLTGAPGTTPFGYVSFSALSGSVTAQTTTNSGALVANMTVTVNNVTATTFDIVYTVSDNGGAGAPTQNFSVSWTVMG